MTCMVLKGRTLQWILGHVCIGGQFKKRTENQTSRLEGGNSLKLISILTIKTECGCVVTFNKTAPKTRALLL